MMVFIHSLCIFSYVCLLSATCSSKQLDNQLLLNNIINVNQNQESSPKHVSIEDVEDLQVRIIDKMPYNKAILQNDLKQYPHVQKYINEMLETGQKRMKATSRYLQRKFKNQPDITKLIDAKENLLAAEIKAIVDNIIKREVNGQLEKEYLFLNVITDINTLIYNKAKEIIDTVSNDDTLLSTQLQMVKDKLQKNNAEYMKNDMAYLCASLEICKPYPGFSEYTVKFIDEILKLDNKKINIIGANLKQINSSILFKMFTQEIGFYITLSESGVGHNFKEIISVVRQFIANRYRIGETQDEGLKNKGIAGRILLDILDQTFHLQTDDLTPTTFISTIKAVQEWDKMHNDIETPIKLLVDHIVGVLEKNWMESNEIKEEIFTLLDIIVLGKTFNKVFQNRLFSYGSVINDL